MTQFQNTCLVFIKLEMAMLFENVVLSSLTEKGELKQNYSTPVRLEIFEEKDKFQIKVINGKFVSLAKSRYRKHQTGNASLMITSRMSRSDYCGKCSYLVKLVGPE